MLVKFNPGNLLKTLFSIILAVTLFAMSPVLAGANYDPGPADSITRLVSYLQYDNGDPNRIPLILIHGIHGTEDYDENGILDESETGQFAGWDNFLSKYNESPGLQSQYKIYRFLYLSDKQSVWEIARSLRNHIDDAIDAGGLKDGEFVILAHSMGGLVARSYMNEHDTNTGISDYKGKRAGERVLQLITLATPHHGSPMANQEPRFSGWPSDGQLSWDASAKGIDYLYWSHINGCEECTYHVDFNSIISIESLITNIVENLNAASHPNRGDLRWDNFDQKWGSEYENDSNEKNTWLRDLNGKEGYHDKIITYYGYIGSDLWLQYTYGSESYVENVGWLTSPTDLLAPAIRMKLNGTLDENSLLKILGAYLERIRNNDTSGLINEFSNDGMVPKESAAFDNHTTAKQVECPNHDHLDMLDGKTTTCNNGFTLLDSVGSDLAEIYTEYTTTSCTDSYESNDSSSQAYGPLSSGSNYSGKICTSTDADWFKVNLSSVGTISLSLSVPSSNDYDLQLYNPSYSWVAESYNGTGVSEAITYSAATTGTYYIRVYNPSGSYNTTSSYTLSYNFTTGTMPTVTTSTASSITSTGATINGSVNPNGSSTNAWFEWGTSSNLSTYNSTPLQSPGSGTTAQSISASLSGLNPSTTYYYRVAASNSAGTSRGSSILSFTTSSSSTAQTELITNGSFSSGTSGWTLWGDFWAGTTLSNYKTSPGYAAGGVDSSGSSKNSATGYMYQTITVPSAANSPTLSFWYNITSQETGTTAYDVLTVTIQDSSGNYLGSVGTYSNVNKDSAAGSSYYHQQTFDMTPYKGQTVRVNFLATTDSSNSTVFRIDDVSIVVSYSAPSVTTSSASAASTSATLNGSVNPNGLAATAWFEYGTNSSLSTYTQTTSQSLVSGTTSQSISASLSGLSPSTTYYYRAVASNSVGTQSGSILNFTTQATPVVTRTLTVSSSNPNSGVSITVSPNDNNGYSNGTTSFTRTYNDKTSVTLTASATASGNNFQKWQKNGVDYSTSSATSITMDADYTMTAVYTTPVDTTPPAISSTSPANNATNVTVGTTITATFSENIDPSTATITLKQGNTYLSGNLSSTTQSATFTPSSTLAYSTTYTAAIQAGLKDSTGNTMASDYTWSFTTEAAPPGPPSAPTNITAIAGDGQVIIGWDNISDTTSYNVYWSTSSGVTKTTGTKITGATSPYTHTGLTNGTTYYYAVTAVNSYGESSESSQVSGNPQSGWALSTIDSSGYVVYKNSIATDLNNKIHISYYVYDLSNGSLGDLKYATNASGSWETATIDSLGTVGSDSSIAIDGNNKVHISYSDSTNTNLKYATNTSGSWVASTIDSTGDVGRSSSIAVDSNNKVHIAYRDESNGVLKYATNASGSWATSIADSSFGAGLYASIAIDSNNKAHIGHFLSASSDLKYTTNASGSWVSVTIDSTGSVGAYTSLALDTNNKAHISYLDSTESVNDLKYATNASGAWGLSTIDSDGSVGSSSIAVDSNNKVHVAYSESTNGNLKYATNASGSWTTSIVDSIGGGYWAAITADLNNKIHISYTNSNRHLKYANYSDITSPTDGTLTATAGDGQVSLSWSGFSDTASGIASYKLVYSTSSIPSSLCSDGTQIYSGSGTSYAHTGLTNGTTYYYRVCATDNAGNTSTGATANAAPISDTNPPSNTTSSNFINSGATYTTSTSITLSISATDNVGITGYYASENSSTPSATASGWVSFLLQPATAPMFRTR